MPMHPHSPASMSPRERAQLVEAAQRRAQWLRRQAIAGLWDAVARGLRALGAAPLRALRGGAGPRSGKRQPCT